MNSSPMQDVRGWSRTAAFAVEHPAHCSNPVYVRALIPWHPAMAGMASRPVFRQLFWLLPKFLGAKVLVCATCSTVEHESTLEFHFAMILNHMFGLEGKERPLFIFDSDTDLVPDDTIVHSR